MPFSKLFDKKILMITGKGGIGKSLVAASLGILASQQGKKVCLIESNSEDQLGPLLGVGTVGHHLTSVNPRLSVINLDSNLNFRDFIVMHLGFARVFDQIFTKPLVQSFVRMIPGIAEVTLLGRLFFHAELDEEERFDLVIFDGFASGHFKSLMSTPDAILNAGFVGPIIKETQRVRDYICDPRKTGIAVVANPEPLILTESLEFVNALKSECPVELTSVLINRYIKAPKPIVPQDVSEESDSHQIRDQKVVFDYLFSEHQRQMIDLSAFMQDLEGVDDKLSDELLILDEEFFMEEPLRPEFVKRWLERGSLWQTVKSMS